MPEDAAPTRTTGQCATLACLLEVTAPKVGNVHRGADFEDLTYFDFVASAVAIGPTMDAAAESRLGQTVLRAVQATREAVGTNTNLGTILLLAPLAAVPRGVPLADGLPGVLAALDADDARDVYAAIRLAQPGGLGRVEQDDVAGPPPADLLESMRAAAGRDLVARQYAEGFSQVLGEVVPALEAGLACGWSLGDVIVHTQLAVMSRHPDSLIARKCGPEAARRASDQAAAVLAAGSPGEESYLRALADLDFWLRCDGHRRNPGTTADLLAAALFVCLREGRIRRLRL